MKKVVGGVLGAVAGTFLLGVGGYLYGLLFLAWFGPDICCGLDGLLPPIVGTVTGATLGFTVGAMTGVLVSRRSPLKLVRLVVLLVAGVAIAWLVSLAVGGQDVERVLPIASFLAATLYLPAIVWITGVWEKPDTSI